MSGFKFPIVRRVYSPLFNIKVNPYIQPMTIPHSSVFSINYTYRQTRTKEEWKQMYFDGEKACFDWEWFPELNEWSLRLPNGIDVCTVSATQSNGKSWACCFYPLSDWQYSDEELPDSLLNLGKKYALDYGFKILDHKYKAML